MTTDAALQDDALRLAELDRKVIRAVHERNTAELCHKLVAYIDLRKSLKTRLLDLPAIHVENPDAAAIFRLITTDEGLPSDKIIERLEARGGGEVSPIDFDEEELGELGSDLLYSWFSHYEYVLGLAELRPLVLRTACSKAVSQLVGQVKNCYAFQQYDAAYALCRMVIEAAARDICVKCQLFPDLKDNAVLFEEHKWHTIRDKVSSGPLKERLRVLYSDLSKVIHSRKSVTKEDALRSFSETLRTVEQLYVENNL